MDQLQQDFRNEIGELLEHVFSDLDVLRNDLRQGLTKPRVLRSLFRNIHSIKGCAATDGRAEVSTIAHQIEDLLSALRLEKVSLNDDVINVLDDGAQLMSDYLGSSPPDSSALSLFTNSARTIARDNSESPAVEIDLILNQLPSDIWQSLSADQRGQLSRALAKGDRLFLVCTSFNVDDFDQKFYELREKIEDYGEVLLTYPSVDEQQPGKINFRLLLISKIDFATTASSSPEFGELEIKSVASSSERKETAKPEVPEQEHDAVRLPASEIDSLWAPIQRASQLTGKALQLAGENVPAEVSEQLEVYAAELRDCFTTLENRLQDLRLVVLSQVLKRVERAGRTAARAAGKAVRFETAGLDLRLDKSIAAAVIEPLIHLVRNAVDHGIEPSSERIGAAKDPEGTIRIEAQGDGDSISLRVSDDGRGISPTIVAEAARRAGLLEPGRELSLDEALKLIFQPGFSTAEAVSETSGRGVGLDVVATRIKQIGGVVRVSSESGKGSVFEISLNQVHST